MRLDRLQPSDLLEALRIYLDLAWPPDSETRPSLKIEDLEKAGTTEELLSFFDRPPASETSGCARYTLRFGNSAYPFMKFVIQEYLVEEEYFFSVDTHDDIKIEPGMPDYEGWQAVRAYNRELKERIEHAWKESGLPTHEDLRQLMEGIAGRERGKEQRARLLVVDDERDVAEGLAAVLTARGYEVEVAFDGRQVLDRLERDPVPDLVLLDYSMPEFDGEEVMRRVRSGDRCRDIPFLLATATSIDLTSVPRTSGLLRKPYQREVLFAMIRELLGARPEAGGPSGATGATGATARGSSS